MTKATEQMTEAELADHYDTHRNADEWGEPEPVEPATRREVTISVRFSEAEIAAVRAEADLLGMKPTAYIRDVVLRATSAGDTEHANMVVIEEVAEQLGAVAREAESARERLGFYRLRVSMASGRSMTVAKTYGAKKTAAKKTTAKKTTARKATAKKAAAKKTSAKKTSGTKKTAAARETTAINHRRAKVRV